MKNETKITCTCGEEWEFDYIFKQASPDDGFAFLDKEENKILNVEDIMIILSIYDINWEKFSLIKCGICNAQ